MKTNKIKKLYNFDLQNKYKDKIHLDRNATLDYKLREFFEELCDDGLYQYDYSERPSKLRITFPLFLLAIVLLNVVSIFKWLFTGSSRFNNKSWVISRMIKWDKYCGFNLI